MSATRAEFLILKEMLDKLVDYTQKNVTGDVDGSNSFIAKNLSKMLSKEDDLEKLMIELQTRQFYFEVESVIGYLVLIGLFFAICVSLVINFRSKLFPVCNFS